MSNAVSSPQDKVITVRMSVDEKRLLRIYASIKNLALGRALVHALEERAQALRLHELLASDDRPPDEPDAAA